MLYMFLFDPLTKRGGWRWAERQSEALARGELQTAETGEIFYSNRV